MAASVPARPDAATSAASADSGVVSGRSYTSASGTSVLTPYNQVRHASSGALCCCIWHTADMGLQLTVCSQAMDNSISNLGKQLSTAFGGPSLQQVASTQQQQQQGFTQVRMRLLGNVPMASKTHVQTRS